MKRKTLIILGIAYLVFVAIVLAVGLRINKTSLTPRAMSGTDLSSAKETPSTPGGVTPTTGETGSPTAALTGMVTAPVQPSPSLTSTSLTSTAFLTQPSAEPAFTQTRRPNISRTATQGAYPINADSTATQPPYPVDKTQTRTTEPTQTKTPKITQTPTQQTGWEGEWVVWCGIPGDVLEEGLMTVSIVGGDIKAVAAIGGIELEFDSEYIFNDQAVFGKYTSQSGNGTFYWEMISNIQFKGRIDNSKAFCAARLGESKPDHCGIFIPY